MTIGYFEILKMFFRQASTELSLTLNFKPYVTLSLSKCDFKLFQNFKHSFVSLLSSTGSEQAFDKLRASWLSLTINLKSFVILSFCRSVTLSFFKISSILSSGFDWAQPDIRFKISCHTEQVYPEPSA